MDSLCLDEELICAVCRDIFTEPVTLPCGHNYCEECVNELKRSVHSVQDGDATSPLVCHYNCPLCLAPCDSVVQLKKNTVLYNIIEKYRRQRDGGVECSVCKGQQKLAAEKSCLTCEESYCALHVMPHLENSTFRQHVLVQPVANSSRLCKEHGKQLELFCKTDATALCAYCMLPSEAKHLDGHNVVKLTDAQTNLKENCQAKLNIIKHRLSEMNDGLSKLEAASASSQLSLESQLHACLAVLKRVRLFLDLEERAWQKRFSLDLVQERRAVRLRTEKLSRLKTRLLQAHEGLLQALSITDPLALLQTVQNPDWVDLFDEQRCKHQILDAVVWKKQKPIAAAKISPLLQTVCRTFAGEDIILNAASAHPRLGLNADRSAVWVTTEGASGPGDSESSEALYWVLGEIPFTRGVHHWEVSVAAVPSWAIGVAYGSVQDPAAGGGSLGRDELSWALSYCSSKRQFCAQHSWLCFCFSDSATGIPDTVGVFLDIDSGFLSFYDAVSMGHLYTFYCDIQAPVYPVFCLGAESMGGGSQQMRVLNPISKECC